jgi:hypothetical protein
MADEDVDQRMNSLAERMRDDYGVDLTEQYADGTLTPAQLVAAAQLAQQGYQPGQDPNAAQQQQTAGAGEVIGGEYTDWSGGVVEDVPSTGGSSRDGGGESDGGGQWDSGYGSGYLDGYDAASEDFENLMDDQPDKWD